MEQIIKRALRALPFTIALFDDSGDAGGAGSGADGGDSGQGAGSGTGTATATGAHTRNGRAGATSTSDGQRVYATDIDEANRRIAELNEEAATRRRENRDLKKELGSVQSRQTLVDQRAIRMEAREALRAAGIVRPDLLVDVFLKHAGDAIKIDDKTGDVVGIEASVPKFKEAAPDFFKAADSGQGSGNGQGNGAASGAATGQGDGSGSGAGTGANGSGNGADADTRGNATGTGASVAGGGNSGQGGFKVANFRDPNVNAKDAMARYKASLR